MRDVLGEAQRWRAAGHGVALARVVAVEGSGPREPGAAMALSEEGRVAGSVSGGCVEAALVSEALDVINGGPARVATFGYSDEEAFEVGLTCGGTVHVLVDVLARWPPGLFDRLRAALVAGRAVALVTMTEGPRVGATLLVGPGGAEAGSLGDAGLDVVAARDAVGELEAGRTSTRHYGPSGEARRRDVAVFVESFAPPPRMVILGAVDFTGALARVAKVLGYRVTVCDARPVFATADRFPMADEVVVDWPDRYLDAAGPRLGPRDAVCVLTHDQKFDVPGILAALRTGAGYVGAMGSRRTQAARELRLREAGVGDDDLRRLMAPIGLDIGARTPEETAVSICAEIIALRTGRRPPSLRDTAGPIHASRR